MQSQKDLGPKSLREAFERIAKSLGGWWISGIILTIIFAVIFKVWTNSNLVPALLLFGVVTRIYPVNFPIHRMLEIVTISTIIIVLKFNPLIGAVFGLSVFVISRFFGAVEAPDMTLLLGFSTAVMAYLVPYFTANYTLIYAIIILSAIRVLIVEVIYLVILKKIAHFFGDTISALIVGCGLNYGLFLFLIKIGLI